MSNTPDPRAIELGKIGGRSKSINAVQRRIDELVEQAPELTDQQINRLRDLLRGAQESLATDIAARLENEDGAA